MLFGQCLPSLTLDLFVLVRNIRFVGDQDFLHIGLGMSLNLLQPVLDVVESGHFSTVIDQQDAHGALVVRLCNGAESFLASGVPHLELDRLVENFDGLDPEIYADGGHVGGWELVIREAQ